MIPLTVVAVWVAAAIVVAVRPVHRLAAAVTVSASVVALILAVLWATGTPSGDETIEADALARLLLVVISAVAMAAAMLSAVTMEGKLPHSRARRRYWTSLDLFVASIVAVPLASNLAWMWIAVELTTVFSVLLVATAGTTSAMRAAWRYALLTLAGSSIALFGILLLAGVHAHSGGGPLTWDRLSAVATQMPALPTRVALLLVIIGLGTKVGVVPLHTWIARAYAESPLPICILFSGAEAVAVLGVLFRVVALGSSGPTGVGTWVLVLGLLTVAVGALLIVQAHDLRRLFAYSSIEQVGVVLVGVGIGTQRAVDGATVQLVGQALAKTVCFIGVAMIAERFATVEIRRLGGLIGVRGSGASVFLLAAGSIAIAGIPPSLLFLGEFTIVRAALESQLYAAAAVLLLFVSIAAVALLWHVARTVAGVPRSLNEAAEPARKRGRWVMTAAVSALACAVMIAGIALPPALSDLIQKAL